MSIKGTFLGAPWERFVPGPGADPDKGGLWTLLLVQDCLIAAYRGGVFVLRLIEIDEEHRLHAVMHLHGLHMVKSLSRPPNYRPDEWHHDGRGRWWRDTRLDVSPELQAELDAEQTSLGD